MPRNEFLFRDEQSFCDIFNKYLGSEKQSKVISELKKLEGDKREIATSAVNSEGIGAFDVAVCEGKLLVAEYLYELSVQEGQNIIDQVDNYGRAPIHKAIAGGNIEVVRFLIERNCDLRLSTQIGDKTYCDVNQFLGYNHDKMNGEDYWSAIAWVNKQPELVKDFKNDKGEDISQSLESLENDNVASSNRTRVESNDFSEARSGRVSRTFSLEDCSARPLNLRKKPGYKKEPELFSDISNPDPNPGNVSYVEVKKGGRCNIL